MPHGTSSREHAAHSFQLHKQHSNWICSFFLFRRSKGVQRFTFPLWKLIHFDKVVSYFSFELLTHLSLSRKICSVLFSGSSTQGSSGIQGEPCWRFSLYPTPLHQFCELHEFVILKQKGNSNSVINLKSIINIFLTLQDFF